MRLATWNVNGIRAVTRNGFFDWFCKVQADIICLQETKANPGQLENQLLHPSNYHSFWHAAEKAGYSGVVIYTRKEPLKIQLGMGIPEFDNEGRVLVAEFSDFYLINAYFPNSQRDHARLNYKLAFCQEIHKFIDKLKSNGKNVLICGDLNIAHHEIDLKNPKLNLNNAGFLPQERQWLTQFLNQNYIDTFRQFTPDPGHYTWWSYRPGVREKNIGWRLDYFITNRENKDRIKSVIHQPEVKGSDHCPVVLELRS